MKAVQAVVVEVRGVRKCVGSFFVQGGYGPRDPGRDHRDLEPQPRRVFELFNCLARRMHRNRGGRRQSIAICAANLRVHDVECAACRPPHVGVVDRRERQPQRRIHHGEIDSDFLEPLMQQPRRHHRRQVVGIVADSPPCAAHVARVAITARAGRMLAQLGAVAICHLRAADLGQVMMKQRLRLDQMSVGVDYRMIELRAQCLYASRMVRLHGPRTPQAGDSPPST